MSVQNLTRQSVLDRREAIRKLNDFDARGICTDVGKYEGCYESTVYFDQLEISDAFGFRQYGDGSSDTVFRVSEAEKAILAGPWDNPGSIWNDKTRVEGDTLLYLVMVNSDGIITSSHTSIDSWRSDRRQGYIEDVENN